jgi:hypothetical protein
MSAMARELVEKAGVGEFADAVWRDLGQERERAQPRSAVVEPEPEMETVPILGLPGVFVPEPAPAPFGIHLLEPAVSAKKRRKQSLWPTANEENAQLSLFG